MTDEDRAACGCASIVAVFLIVIVAYVVIEALRWNL